MNRAVAMVLAISVLLAVAGRSFGRDGAPPSKKALLERLAELSPEKRAELLQRLKRWKSMTPQEKSRIRDQLQSFKALPDQERKTLENRLKRLNRKDPEKKEELTRRFRIWKGLSPSLKNALRRRYKSYTSLTREQRERLQQLPDSKKREALNRMHLQAEVGRLLNSLPKAEREAVAALPLAQQKSRALAFLQARQAALLDRMPDAKKQALKKLEPDKRRRAQAKWLREVNARDRTVLALLTPDLKKRFLSLPVAERDGFALEQAAAHREELLGELRPDQKRSLEAVAEADRPWDLLKGVLTNRLEKAQEQLLPSQRRAMASQSLVRKWERTQSYRAKNHKRLLAKLPEGLRDDLEPLSQWEQERRIARHLEDILRGLRAPRLQKRGIRELPLLLRWDAVRRLAGSQASRK